MDYPKNVLEIVETATRKYPTDIEGAVQQAEKAVRKLPEFDELVEKLVHDSIQGLVYDVRHRLNIQMRQEAGGYGGPAKVVSGDSTAANRMEMDLYRYNIAGTSLGNMKGEELVPTADAERAKGEGCLFNSRLCRRLAAIVPEGKAVRDVVSATKLRSIFMEVGKVKRRHAEAAC